MFFSFCRSSCYVWKRTQILGSVCPKARRWHAVALSSLAKSSRTALLSSPSTLSASTTLTDRCPWRSERNKFIPHYSWYFKHYELWQHANFALSKMIIIIIKIISRAPIYHTRWQHRALYNNTNHTHTHSIGRGDGQGCEKRFRNNLI